LHSTTLFRSSEAHQFLHSRTLAGPVRHGLAESPLREFAAGVNQQKMEIKESSLDDSEGYVNLRMMRSISLMVPMKTTMMRMERNDDVLKVESPIRWL